MAEIRNAIALSGLRKFFVEMDRGYFAEIFWQLRRVDLFLNSCQRKTSFPEVFAPIQKLPGRN